MGGYYARHDGLGEDIALAIEDHYKPRFAGDELPRNEIGVVVALADKLETLVGMFGIGNLPTGDKDPFALRRHALGVIRMLVERDIPINCSELVQIASKAFAKYSDLSIYAGSGVPAAQTGDQASWDMGALLDFIFDRLAGSLRDEGYSAQEVDAVLALRPQRLGDVAKRLAAVRAFAGLPEAPALAAANKRVGNILKKAEGAVEPRVNDALLAEPAEKDLAIALKSVAPQADAAWADRKSVV